MKLTKKRENQGSNSTINGSSTFHSIDLARYEPRAIRRRAHFHGWGTMIPLSALRPKMLRSNRRTESVTRHFPAASASPAAAGSSDVEAALDHPPPPSHPSRACDNARRDDKPTICARPRRGGASGEAAACELHISGAG